MNLIFLVIAVIIVGISVELVATIFGKSLLGMHAAGKSKTVLLINILLGLAAVFVALLILQYGGVV